MVVNIMTKNMKVNKNRREVVYWIQKLCDMLEKVTTVLVIISMATIAIIIPYEVLGRFILKSPPSWVGEMGGYALVWIGMFGGAIGLRRNIHPGMMFVHGRMPSRIARFMTIASIVGSIVILAIIMVFGFKQLLFAQRISMASIDFSMFVPYLAIPVGCFIMICFFVEKFSLIDA